MIPKNTRFLVVDDVAIMRHITASLLRNQEFSEIETAADGKEALQVIEQRPIDIVLSDWNMPVMSGLELLKALRQNPRTAKLPFVMITADTDRSSVGEAIAAGVSNVLVKPYASGELLARIEAALTTPRAPQLESIAAARAPVAAPTLPTVLVVDDTPANLQVLYELLKGEFRVRTASNGQKALDICQSESRPDMVLLDIMMPEMDGFEVARRLRQHPSSETLPVIFVTAKTDQESRLKGLELGAVDFVTKPVDPEVLLPRVRNFMRYVALHKELQLNYDAMLETARLREDVEQITRHDLRGPLASIVSLAQSLAANTALGTDELEQAQMIAESGLQVLDMINLSSELFKIETGRFTLNAVPLALDDLLARIVKSTVATYASKGITLTLEKHPPQGNFTAQGDSAFCHSIFQNLVKNACEAAPEQSAVSLSLSLGDDGKIQTVIANQGVVPTEMRASFFEKFSTQGKSGGTGLGTYSAKLLTEAQGGEIEMQTSDADNRTQLTVRLPSAAV